MALDTEDLIRWQESANALVATLQDHLAPYDPLIRSWVSPYFALPDMPGGLLTGLSLPVALVAIVLIATLFDMFGTLLLRLTFRYQRRAPFHPAMWQLYDTVNRQLAARYRLIPWVTLYDLVEFSSGSKRQCLRHRQKLLNLHIDGVIVDKETTMPKGVLMLALPSRPSRTVKQRYRRVRQACKRAGLDITEVSLTTNGNQCYVSGLDAFGNDQQESDLARQDTTQQGFLPTALANLKKPYVLLTKYLKKPFQLYAENGFKNRGSRMK